MTSAATIVSRDLVARFRPDTSVKTQVRFGQAALIAVMVIGITVVLFVIDPILALIAIVAILSLVFLGDTINDLMSLIGASIEQST